MKILGSWLLGARLEAKVLRVWGFGFKPAKKGFLPKGMATHPSTIAPNGLRPMAWLGGVTTSTNSRFPP